MFLNVNKQTSASTLLYLLVHFYIDFTSWFLKQTWLFPHPYGFCNRVQIHGMKINDTIWYDTTWYDMIWYDIYDMIQYDMWYISLTHCNSKIYSFMFIYFINPMLLMWTSNYWTNKYCTHCHVTANLTIHWNCFGVKKVAPSVINN